MISFCDFQEFFISWEFCRHCVNAQRNYTAVWHFTPLKQYSFEAGVFKYTQENKTSHYLVILKSSSQFSSLWEKWLDLCPRAPSVERKKHLQKAFQIWSVINNFLWKTDAAACIFSCAPKGPSSKIRVSLKTALMKDTRAKTPELRSIQPKPIGYLGKQLSVVMPPTAEKFSCANSPVGTMLKKSSGAWTTHTNKHLQNTTSHHGTSPSGASGRLKPSVGSSPYFSYHIRSIMHLIESNLEKHPTRRNNWLIWDFCRRWEIPLPVRTLALNLELHVQHVPAQLLAWNPVSPCRCGLCCANFLTDQGH